MQILHKNTHTYCFVCHPTSSSCQGEKTDINTEYLWKCTLWCLHPVYVAFCNDIIPVVHTSQMVNTVYRTVLLSWCFRLLCSQTCIMLPSGDSDSDKKKKYYTCIHMFYIPSFLVLWHGERSKLKHFYDYSPCTQIRSLSTIFNCMLKEFLWLLLFINQKSKITCTCNFPAEYYIYI